MHKDHDINIIDLELKPVNPVQDEDIQVFQVPLDGQWVPSVDPLVIGTNFKTMTNMRYATGHPETVRGMTKINTTALTTYLKARTAFQFVKELHSENHVLIQAYNDALTGAQILQNTTTIPSQGDYSGTALWTDSAGASLGVFSNAPSGHMAYCNGIDTCIWGGNETRCGAVISSSATLSAASDTVTTPQEYTDQMSNMKTDSDNVLSIGGGIDDYVSLLIHANEADTTAGTSILDSSTATTKTITAVGNAQVDTDFAKFGSGSVIFDGTGDYLTVPYHADFNFGTGDFTIDFWVRPSASSATNGLCGEYTDANNYWGLYITTGATLTFEAKVSSSFIAKYSCSHTFTGGTWYHITLEREGSNIYLFVDGVLKTSTITTAISTTSMPTFSSGTLEIGAYNNHATLLTGHLDEFRISKGIARWPVPLYSVDSYTKLLIHADQADGTAGTSITDSCGKTITAVGNAQIDTAFYKLGNGSIVFDGTGDYLTVPDSTDWYFGADQFTIDCWVRFSALTGVDAYNGICGQWVDADNYWHISVYTGNLQFYCKVGGVVKAYYVADLACRYTDTWYHIEIARNGTSMYAFVNGTQQTFRVLSEVGTNEIPNLAASLTIGTSGGGTSATEGTMYGWIDEFRISKGIARHTSNFVTSDGSFSAPASYYSTGTLIFLVGSTRPASGGKLYISLPNQSASAISIKQFNGNFWETLTVTSDGTLDTATSTISLNKTGTISWGSTVSTAKPKFMEGYYLYWYLFTLSAGGAEIYHISLDIPFQNIIDIWDGYYSGIASAFYNTTARLDIASSIYEYEYVGSDTSTYTDVSSMTDAYGIELGFVSKQTGLFVALPPDYVNITADRAMTVSYWGGDAYATVGTISDGTLVSTKSFGKSGIVTWSNNNVGKEKKLSVDGGIPLYWYKITFSGTLDASVRVYFIGGIPLADEIKGYSFCALGADRLLIGCDNYEEKNALRISAQDQPDVFNGDDSFNILFGDDNALMGAAAIFAQYSSNIYNIILVLKKSETWILVWNQTSTGTSWSRFRISPNVGLLSSRTLCTASVIFENNINQSKVVGIWRSNDGIYLSNGQAPFLVSHDIESVFDQTSTTHVNLTMVGREYSFIDQQKLEYHWLWASGTSSTLNKEYVLDLKKWRWFEIDRATGNRLQCGVNVVDTYGSNYQYGFIDTGYTERLENGTDFDGTDITSTLEFGGMLPVSKNFAVKTEVLKANLVAVKKTTDTTVTMTHYIDEATSGTSYNFSLVNASGRVANDVIEVYSTVGVFHGFKLVNIADDETKGFEPLFFSIYYRTVRENL